MRIDKSELSVVAICDACGWRDTRPTPARAWTALAVPLKNVHDDPAAVARVRAAARKSEQRAVKRHAHTKE